MNDGSLNTIRKYIEFNDKEISPVYPIQNTIIKIIIKE